ncbi:MAG: polysaccharide deacetylase family protein [Clostridiales Family XIII bacterium]|jgi:peptidoglycan/xylan/chitin deacetylase (PgdA/CDA1 family)|nr:polysaccharide deacetylase family protein [Clostridiales Family XIII bacterium]
MKYELNPKTKYIIRVALALFLTFLILAVVTTTIIISDNADSDEEERVQASSVATADAMRFAPPAVSGVMKHVAATIGSCLGRNFIPQPKDLLSFRFDARRLIFGAVGDALKLELVTTPEADVSGVTPVYTTSDDKVATVAEDGTVTATGFGRCVVSAQMGNLSTSANVAVAKKWAAVTFDDGPGKYTPRLLEALRKRGITATFFVVGRNGVSKSGQSSLNTMALDGDEIGNHTYAHDYNTKNLQDGLEQADKVILRATGKTSALMRPPGGIIDQYTKKCGKPIIMWTIDPEDWKHRDVDYVTKHVMKKIKSGAIVLLHDIHETSVDAALRIYDDLEAEGYTFVNVTDLLGEPEAGTTYFKGPAAVPTKKILY